MEDKKPKLIYETVHTVPLALCVRLLVPDDKAEEGYSVRNIGTFTSDELAQFARDFNHMTWYLSKQEKEKEDGKS